MPNPRYLTENGQPQVELLKKLSLAKRTFYENLPSFCQQNYLNLEELKSIDGVFLIGSHATKNEWHNDSSDLDLKLINSRAVPENLWRYKRIILDPILCDQSKEKRYWIDLYFALKNYQVTSPKWDLTKYWNEDI
ncbi:MAG: hypothetical protein WAU65_00285 [Candidatus Nanoarchaeia archaeon]